MRKTSVYNSYLKFYAEFNFLRIFYVFILLHNIHFLFVVVYDGCPQSFSMGIWWDRTLFENEAHHACPKGSVGKLNFIDIYLIELYMCKLKGRCRI